MSSNVPTIKLSLPETKPNLTAKGTS